MTDAAWLEVRIYLALLVMCGLAYLAGWIISRWYNNYPKRRGNGSRKKG